MKTFLFRLASLFRRKIKEDELQEELEFHLNEEADELQERGLSSNSARLAARRNFGNIARMQEDTRSTWTWTMLEQLVQDSRYAFRTMAANKTFHALAILSLALGIGANTAVFSLMDSILVRSLPVQDPKSLVMFNWHTAKSEFHGSDRHDDNFDDPNGGFVGGIFSYPAFELFQKNTDLFSDVFGYQSFGTYNVAANGQAALARTEYVSGNYFRGLGVVPAAGRLISPDDDRAGAASVVTISAELSRKQFGAPANAVNRKILINNIPFTVIGVTSAEFFGADSDAAPDIYLPMHANLVLEAKRSRAPADMYTGPDFQWVVIMGRLKPGIGMAQAQAALDSQYGEWERVAVNRPANDVPQFLLRDGSAGLDGLRRRYSQPLYILLALAGLILAIACVNIANLLLARGAARKREIAVRLSMGAGRFRVIRQLLTESILLAALGGLLGIVFALYGIRFLTVLLALGRDNFTFRAELNWHVLGALAALSIFTGILFGLAPAVQATKSNLSGWLKEAKIGGRRGSFFRKLTLGRTLIVAQIGISLMILVCAGLFLRTLSKLQSIPLGFNRENILTFRLNAQQAGRADSEIPGFYNHLRDQFAAIPGVRDASLSDVSLIGDGTSGTPVRVVGENSTGERERSPSILTVGPEFFKTMQIPILIGRETSANDLPDSPKVALVNEAFAKKHFGSDSPIGHHLTFPYSCKTCDLEIVGVSANTLYGNLKGKIDPTVYIPFAQSIWGPMGEMTFELRVSGSTSSIAQSVRDIVHQADSRMPLSELKTQNELIDRSISQEVAFARLCTTFAVLALIIGCVGLYGTMSYTVARRTNEIGIRLALGAPRRSVVWMVLGEVLALVGIGLAISIPAAFATAKLVESFLFDVKSGDLAANAGAMIVLAAASIVAGYLPARNAARTDPMVALRHE